MPFLIDGDNLLGTWGRPRTDAGRRRLAMELARLARGLGKRITVVFDGTAPPALAFGADVHFAGRGRSADDRMLALLDGERDRRGWTVVTSDRSLGDRCRWRGARVERCDLFRRRLGTSPGVEKPDREPDVDYWLKQFGDDAD